MTAVHRDVIELRLRPLGGPWRLPGVSSAQRLPRTARRAVSGLLAALLACRATVTGRASAIRVGGGLAAPVLGIWELTGLGWALLAAGPALLLADWLTEPPDPLTPINRR